MQSKWGERGAEGTQKAGGSGVEALQNAWCGWPQWAVSSIVTHLHEEATPTLRLSQDLPQLEAGPTCASYLFHVWDECCLCTR